jgi:hypothetical protein
MPHHVLQINEAVVNREQLLLVPDVADRKRLILQLLQRNNITLRCSCPPLSSCTC